MNTGTIDNYQFDFNAGFLKRDEVKWKNKSNFKKNENKNYKYNNNLTKSILNNFSFLIKKILLDCDINITTIYLYIIYYIFNLIQPQNGYGEITMLFQNHVQVHFYGKTTFTQIFNLTYFLKNLALQ